MAQYPTAAVSYGTKNTGDTIDASHINDLQTEVEAIEDGLLNGISHDLNPSTNSTRSLGSASARWRTIQGTTIVANRVESTSLSVAGNSTVGTMSLSSAGGSSASADTNAVYANSIVKAWVSLSSAFSINGSFNVSTVSGASSNAADVSFGTALASSNYAAAASAGSDGVNISIKSKASTGFRFSMVPSSNGSGGKNAPLTLLVVGG